MSLKRVSLGLLSLFLSMGFQAQAGRIKAQCVADSSGKISGTNVDSLVEIASVSKVLTAHWLVKAAGAHYRFITKVNITPVGEEAVDVHIAGGVDPLFSKNKLQFLVAQLNKLGVKTIRYLSFDERFFYSDSIRTGTSISSNPEYTVYGPKRTTMALRSAIGSINQGYAAFRSLVEKKENIQMPTSLKIKVGDISPLRSKDYQYQVGTRTYTMASVEAHHLLKEMNRKSNNYIANLIFQSLGGAAAYKSFIETQLGLTARDIQIGNGSGYPMEVGGKRFDNRATCTAVVKIVQDLKESLNEQELLLGDVMAVAGSDSPVDGPSTTTRLYENETTEDALIAKTGTSNPVVALAGAASTQQGVVYFSIMIADGRPGRAASGRGLIYRGVMDMFRKFGGSEELHFKAKNFKFVDQSSLFKELLTTPLP